MLLEKLHKNLNRFLERYQGNHYLLMNLDELKERLAFFIELNFEVSEIESQYEFQSLDEEIEYYKVDKPEFVKYGIYYERIYNIELEKPFGDIKYYGRLLKGMVSDYKLLKSEIIYYRSNQNNKDEIFFRKESKENHTFAIIKALEMIEKYLLHTDGTKVLNDVIADYPSLNWTGTQAKFIELINALNLTNVINNGDSTLQELTKHFGRFLNIEVKDVHGITHDLMMRQEPAKFSKEMATKIEKKRNELLDKDIQRRYKK